MGELGARRARPQAGSAGMPAHIVLVGLMGSGKTTVGAGLAARLGRPFVDSDAEIQRTTGSDGRTIAAADGTPTLLALEARVLLAALAAPGPDVIAAAASVVDDPACRRALRASGVAVIRLRARPATLAARHATGSHRRPLGPDLAAGFAAQVLARAPRFAAVHPRTTIDVDAIPSDVVVERALAALDAVALDGPDGPGRSDPRHASARTGAQRAIAPPSPPGADMDDAIRRELARGQIIDITTTGRRTGEPRRIEIVFHVIDGRIWISGMPRKEPRAWIANLEADRRLTFHLKGSVVTDLPATARIVRDPDERRHILASVARNWGRDDLDVMVAYSPLIEVMVDRYPPAV